MSLVLEGVSKRVEGQHHIYPTDLTLERGTMMHPWDCALLRK